MDVTISMAEGREEMAPPQTPQEVGIHIGYLRRDISDMKKQQEGDMKEIKKSLSDLGTHYVSNDIFNPFADLTTTNAKDLSTFKEWKDTLTGKMIGFGSGLSVASAGLAAGFIKLFGG